MFLEFMEQRRTEVAQNQLQNRLYEREFTKTSLIEVEMSIEILELELNQAVQYRIGIIH